MTSQVWKSAGLSPSERTCIMAAAKGTTVTEDGAQAEEEKFGKTSKIVRPEDQETRSQRIYVGHVERTSRWNQPRMRQLR